MNLNGNFLVVSATARRLGPDFPCSLLPLLSLLIMYVVRYAQHFLFASEEAFVSLWNDLHWNLREFFAVPLRPLQETAQSKSIEILSISLINWSKIWSSSQISFSELLPIFVVCDSCAAHNLIHLSEVYTSQDRNIMRQEDGRNNLSTGICLSFLVFWKRGFSQANRLPRRPHRCVLSWRQWTHVAWEAYPFSHWQPSLPSFCC